MMSWNKRPNLLLFVVNIVYIYNTTSPGKNSQDIMIWYCGVSSFYTGFWSWAGPRYFLPKEPVPDQSASVVKFGHPLPSRNLPASSSIGVKSPIEFLLEDIQKAADQGFPRVVGDLLQKVSQMFDIQDAKQGRRRFAKPMPQPGVDDAAVAETATAPGGSAYRPDFMLCSVLLADKLMLAGMPGLVWSWRVSASHVLSVLSCQNYLSTNKV